VTLRRARLIQLLGLLIAVAGLLGFWLTQDIRDRVEYTEQQRELIGLPERGEVFHASFVVAGRDYDYSVPASECVWRNGVCHRTRPGVFRLGNRTDTIIYVNIIGSDVTMISIPRDIYLPQWQARVNAMYAYQGAQGLKRAVEEIIGLPIDYYVILNIDIFEQLVDSLGGVDINIPYRMYYRDAAADLTIDFQPGPYRLNGEDAAKFVRFRETPRGDYDRIDNIKRLAYAMLGRLQQLHIRAAIKLPELIDIMFENVETNATPAIISQLIPRLASLQLNGATLPTHQLEGSTALGFNRRQVESFLAEVFGGRSRMFVEAPEANILITNRSGEAGLETRLKERFVAMGVPEALIFTREASLDPSLTRVVTTAQHWQDADYYASLLAAGKQQIDRLAPVAGERIDIEIVVGEGSRQSMLVQFGEPEILSFNPAEN
jgi:LCP family protein required for cell wall assembly